MNEEIKLKVCKVLRVEFYEEKRYPGELDEEKHNCLRVTRAKGITYGTPFCHWNPETNHYDYAIIWNRLTSKQREIIGIICCGKLSSLKTAFPHQILNNLPGVVSATLNVLDISED